MECLKDKIAAASDPAQIRVLVIEEDEFTRAIIRLALRGSHYRLSLFDCPADAFTEIERTRPEIIIADSSSSANATRHLINSLKTNAATSLIPIILLHPDTHSVHSDGESKADVTVAKPFKVSHLLAGLASAEAMINPPSLHLRPSDLMTTEFFRW